jgi:hypothetical protein
MAGIFNLWLVDKGTRSDYYWGEGTMYGVGTYLVGYFNEICKASNNAFDSANFSWSGNTANVKPNEIVVYFLQDRSSSLVTAQGGTISHGSGATYTTGAGTISEIYLSEMEGDADYPRLVANIAFHEILHNKLEPNPVADIHAIGGAGLSSPTVSRGMRPTTAEIDFMGPALSRNVSQYTLQM